MKKNIFFIASIWVFGLCVFSYAGNENSEVKKGPSLEDSERARKIVEQQQRPILPPVMPIVPSAVSLTPSPQITAPQINQQAISPAPSVMHNSLQPVFIQQYQTMPVQVIMPQIHTAPMPIEIPNPPVMSTVFGSVEDKGMNKDGSLRLVVNDEMFRNTVEITVLNLNKGTPLLKGAKIINFSDIKNGDIMDITYQEEPKGNIAVFMRVITREEIEEMNRMQEQQLTVTSGESEKKPEGSEKIDKENTLPQPLKK